MKKLIQIAGEAPGRTGENVSHRARGVEVKADTGRNYWRSLDALANRPEFLSWLHREFPEGASEMRDGQSRRNLLKLMAASFGLAGLTACRRPVEKILPNAKGVENYVPGQAYHYATAMPLGGTVMPLLVETHDGRPTKIEGNPDHPYSLGAASGFAQASILSLYDPDRSRTVLQNGAASSEDVFAKFAADHFSKAGDGRGLRFLSERMTSPSLGAVKQHALQKWPNAKWVEHEPINDDNALEGARLVFGQALTAHLNFEKAKVVLSLESDFLGADAGTVLPIKQFSRSRQVEDPHHSQMNRLYAVEANFSLTGAMADHRLRMRSSEVAAFAADLARELGVLPAGLNVLNSGPADKRRRFIAALAKDLKTNAGECVVVAGRRQPAAVHALSHLMNEKLGNIGRTVTFTKLDAGATALTALVGEMSRGEVKTLVILGANPVYATAGNLQFEANLKKVQVSIHLGLEADETAMAATWHVPEAHYLETWSDGRAPDGTVTIQQPMIEPLYSGKSAAELLAMLSSYKHQRGFDIVRNYWLDQWPAGSREKTWREALHNGLIAGSAHSETKPPAVNVSLVAAAIQQLPAAGQGIEVAFYPSYTVHDGRFLNNGWLQECPDPITKQVWGNAALLSPATARRLGLATNDVIKIDRNGVSGEFPAMIQPGHADDAISLTLGYGRAICGRVGSNVGDNVYRVQSSDAPWFQGGWAVTKAGRTFALATTQEHHSMEGRPLIREASLEEYQRNPKFVEEAVHVPPLESIYDEWSYDQGYQWGMAIDLNACIGCNACMLACQSENNIPIVGKQEVMRGREMHWIRLDRYYNGSEEDPELVYQGVACQQCENAPCENVCPVAATVHSPEGLNDMVYNRCIGTRYCANNCPYKVRRFNFLNYHKEITEVEKMVHNPDVSVRMRGVMEKCNYCVQRIQETKIRAKAEGRRATTDGEVLTACQQTCPADAIVFGNINDPESRVAKLKKQERNYAMLAELNVKPRTTYLAKLHNPNPELA
jgi:molybdopterin-containing oxidoreductase family iron-sulfur binding subunit